MRCTEDGGPKPEARSATLRDEVAGKGKSLRRYCSFSTRSSASTPEVRPGKGRDTSGGSSSRRSPSRSTRTSRGIRRAARQPARRLKASGSPLVGESGTRPHLRILSCAPRHRPDPPRTGTTAPPWSVHGRDHDGANAAGPPVAVRLQSGPCEWSSGPGTDVSQRRRRRPPPPRDPRPRCRRSPLSRLPRCHRASAECRRRR